MSCSLACLWLLAATQSLAADDAVLRAAISDDSGTRAALHTVAPKYPRKARRDRIEGRVTVCFDVDREGRPRRIAVRYSSHRDFEKPSMRAVRASTFRPLAADEPLPPIKTCRTFEFRLLPADDASAQ